MNESYIEGAHECTIGDAHTHVRCSECIIVQKKRKKNAHMLCQCILSTVS